MSDSAAAEFTVYQVDGKQEVIAEILNDEGFVTEYGNSRPIDPSDITNGATLVNDDARIGSLTDIGQALEELAVPYLATQDAKGPYDAELRAYTPELGQNTVTGSNAGGVLVSAQTVDALADAADSLLAEYLADADDDLLAEFEAGDTGVAPALARAIKDARGATATQWLRALRALDTPPT